MEHNEKTPKCSEGRVFLSTPRVSPTQCLSFLGARGPDFLCPLSESLQLFEQLFLSKTLFLCRPTGGNELCTLPCARLFFLHNLS